MDLLANLISHYPLDADANDVHGTNHLTPSNITYAAGKISNAASFNGSSSKLEIAGNPFTASQGAFAGWIKRDSVPVGGKCIFSYGGGLIASAGVLDLLVDGDGGTLFRFFIQQNSNGETANQLYTDYSFSINTWYFVVFQSDGSAWSIYVNGASAGLSVLAGSNNGNWFADTTVSATAKTTIGVRWQNNAYTLYFSGLIDQPDFYSQPLTTEKISELYNSGAGLAYADYRWSVAVGHFQLSSAITGRFTGYNTLEPVGHFQLQTALNGIATEQIRAQIGHFSLSQALAGAGNLKIVIGSFQLTSALSGDFIGSDIESVPHVSLFKCFLTGSPILVLPISSFQARVWLADRDHYQWWVDRIQATYLEVVVPNVSLYADGIADRAAGEILIYQYNFNPGGL